jgi:hypothetical protein
MHSREKIFIPEKKKNKHTIHKPGYFKKIFIFTKKQNIPLIYCIHIFEKKKERQKYNK